MLFVLPVAVYYITSAVYPSLAIAFLLLAAMPVGMTAPLLAEISGGKHRFTIRFMEQPDSSARPVQTKDNVRFVLHCCIL